MDRTSRSACSEAARNRSWAATRARSNTCGATSTSIHVGLAVYLVGLATMLASPFIGAAVPDRAQTPTLYGVLGLGAGISIVGAALAFKGEAALIDAVNVYNDDVAEPARAGRP